MNILTAQPLLENELKQLENEIESRPEVDVIIFPEGCINGCGEAIAIVTRAIISIASASPSSSCLRRFRFGTVIWLPSLKPGYVILLSLEV